MREVLLCSIFVNFGKSSEMLGNSVSSDSIPDKMIKILEISRNGLKTKKMKKLTLKNAVFVLVLHFVEDESG